MTAHDRFERELPDLLADLYHVSAPDYRDDLVRQFAATRQRPAWAFPERWIPMRALALGRSVRPLPWRTIGVVALLALAIVAGAIIAGSQQRLPPPFGPAANGNLVVAEDGDIFLIDPATGARTLAIGGPTVDTDPVFSRDGTQIAFYREVTGERGLFVSDAQGRGPHALATSTLGALDQIQWSPDGTSILAMQGGEGPSSAIAIVPLDGSAAKVLHLGMPAEDAVWLPPSGRELLFRTPHPDGVQFGYSLWIVDADGSNHRELVAPGLFEWDALFFAPSPDGSLVSYQQRPSEEAAMVLYVVPTAGGAARAITSVESVGPVWSPDRSWIAFLGEDGTYIVRADGTSPQRRVTTTARAGAATISWSPDGTRLLLVAGSGDPQLLFDPLGGADEVAPWTSTELPDWQRLAPPP